MGIEKSIKHTQPQTKDGYDEKANDNNSTCVVPEFMQLYLLGRKRSISSKIK